MRKRLEDISELTEVNKIPVAGFDKLFGKNGYTVLILFTRGVSRYRKDIPLVALGSLFHMIEDSFSKSHVTRAPPSGRQCPAVPNTMRGGRVLEFLAYNGQDSGKHEKSDSRNGMQAGLMDNDVNALTVGRKLKEMFDAKMPWAEVHAYLDQCVYEVADDDLDKAATAGQNFAAD